MIDIFQHEFAQNGFIAGTIVSVVAAIVGYFVVLRAQAFAAHALSHIGFAGATGAVIIGLSSLTGMVGLTVLAAIGMGILGERIRGRDVEIGMILAFALGLGVLFLHIYTSSATEAVGVLFGSILSVTRADVVVTLCCGAAVLAALSCVFRPLLFASIDPEVAEAKGVPVRFLGIIFMILVAITVAETIQVVGILLDFSLLVAPAAIAQHLSSRPFVSILLSILLGLAFTWGGLILAFIGHSPVSFYIAGLATLAYFTSVNFVHLRSPHHVRVLPHPDREHLPVEEEGPVL
jgi:zinc/manganese transport system permease protein